MSKTGIQVSVIAPLNYLEFSANNDYHLVLPHLWLFSEKYREFIRKEKKTKKKMLILDNGTYEFSEPMSSSLLLRLAEQMSADVVVAPDYIYDAKRTIRLTERFLREAAKSRVKVMAVVQGKNLDEWLSCFERLSRLDVYMIGITNSKLASYNVYDSWVREHLHELDIRFRTSEAVITRILLVKTLVEEELVRESRKCYLLGLPNPIELMYYRKFFEKYIFGCDTTQPIVCGLLGIRFDEKYGLLGEKPAIKLDFSVSMTPKQKRDAWHNVRVMRQFANGSSSLS